MRLASALYNGAYPFEQMNIFDSVRTVHGHDDLHTDEVLIVWGGADISPSLYNKPVSSRTHADDRPSHRDTHEWALMQTAKKKGVPIIGICRGAQMLCALAGGFLIQDSENHTSSHPVETSTGDIFKVNSLHHQMLYPFDVEHEMVAWSKHKLSNYYIDVENEIDIPVEPEFVYFPKEKGIAIQWHPEMMPATCAATQFVEQKLKEYLNV